MMIGEEWLDKNQDPVFVDEETAALQERQPKKRSRSRTSSGKAAHNSFLIRLSKESDALSESNFEVVDAPDADNGKKEAVREVNAVARREILGVRVWKVLFLCLVVLTAALVSVGTYIFISQENEDDYEESYDLFVLAMNDAVKVHVKHIVTVFDNLADMISSDAAAQWVEFPFYTMDNFEATGEGVRALSRVEMYGWFPSVEAVQIPAWMNYSNQNQGWLDTSRKWALQSGEFSVVNKDYNMGPITPFVYDLGGPGGTPQLAAGGPPYSPTWQTSPPVFDPRTINLDFNFFEFARTAMEGVKQSRKGQFTRILISGETGSLGDLIFKPDDHEEFHEAFVDWNTTDHSVGSQPHFSYIQPVFQDAQNTSSRIVGVIAAAMTWDAYLTNLLPEGVTGIYAVVKNTCNQSITYKLTGNRAYFVGWGDLHERSYDETETVIPFYFEEYPDDYQSPTGECIFSFYTYSSQEFEDRYDSTLAIILTCVVAGSFIFIVASYFMYDWFVEKRNYKVVALAAKSNEIVSSLFPKQVRDRLYNGGENDKKKKTGFHTSDHGEYDPSGHGTVRDFTVREDADFTTTSPVDDQNLLDEEGFMYKAAPIADLYTDCTIMFADIAGFTAWSSTREPTQVFRLLETIYRGFDTLAKRRRVFKVETIGDCYVAVTGLPEPMPDHAVVMCRFAKDCLSKMRELTRRLESILGPDTMDLDMRFGLHSGSCTAGVLRGDKSRFQLFGDTMNTASRMESTGRAGMVHISQETADILIAAGKSHWVKPRADKVDAKGKGLLQTYWVSTSHRDYGSELGQNSVIGSLEKRSTLETAALHESLGDLSQMDGSDCNPTGFQEDAQRVECLVKWNVELFTVFLKQISLQRALADTAPQIDNPGPMTEQGANDLTLPTSPLEEFQDSIDFRFPIKNDGPLVNLVPEVYEQLELFISAVCSTYPKHPYHNFSHASHVCLSVVRLLSQLRSDKTNGGESEHDVSAARLVSKDSLAQLACVFAALVQDISHPGIPNFAGQEGRCASQLKSIGVVWQMLMDNPDYSDLRSAIFSSPEELKHFRQVFVQCMLATDLSDKEFSLRRKTRWEKAFGPVSPNESDMARFSSQATLLLETIIQTSNMIHAMQHWDIYCKWNSLLFQEIYYVYKTGGIQQDPSTLWYKSELSFLDKRAIPMLKQLSECGAFKDGAVETYVEFCWSNRRDWESDGENVLSKMLINIADLPSDSTS